MQKKQGKGKSQNFQKPAKTNAGRKPRKSRTQSHPSDHRIGIASYASQPRRVAPKISQQGQSSCHVSGSDYLSTVSIGTATAAGYPVLTVDLAPNAIGLARLQTLSGLYERYTYRKLTFKYCPSCPTTQAGQLIGYVDRDTSQIPLSGTGTYEGNLRRAYAMYGEKPMQVWQGGDRPVTWSLQSDAKLTELYTANITSSGSDPKWASPGRFVLLAASNFDTAVTVGTIYVEYDIEFKYPQWNSPVTGSPAVASQFRGGGGTESLSPELLFPVDSTLVLPWSNSRATVLKEENSIMLQPGKYLTYGIVTYVTGLTGVSVATSGSGNIMDFQSGSNPSETDDNIQVMVTVVVGEGGCRLDFQIHGTYGPASKSQFYVFPFPSGTRAEDLQAPYSVDAKEAKEKSVSVREPCKKAMRTFAPRASSRATSGSTSSATTGSAPVTASWFKV